MAPCFIAARDFTTRPCRASRSSALLIAARGNDAFSGSCAPIAAGSAALRAPAGTPSTDVAPRLQWSAKSLVYPQDLRGEYSNYGFNSGDITPVSVPCGFAGPAVCGVNVSSSNNNIDVVRLGLSYKFGYTAAVYR